MAETRRIKLTKRVSFSLDSFWVYRKDLSNTFCLIPTIRITRAGNAFKTDNKLPRYVIQFIWLYISLDINIFITDKLKDKMRTAKDLYGEGAGWFEYEPMIEEFGEIINKYDFGEYQGDTIVIYKSNNRYGYLLFGWGSCSGCDALQACETIEEVQKLMDALYNSIEWFNSLDELKEWFNQKDWGLEWFGHDPSFKDFTNEIRNL